MIPTVEQTVAARFPQLPGQRVVVAASGGADSTALALVLRHLGCEILLAHLHHGIRGKPADADARFVRALARKLGAPFLLGKFDVPAEARKTGESLEMAARRLRRDYLVSTARRETIRFVATGHTADDQAETVLMRIARGTGIAGLAGIPYSTKQRGITFVRPLRDVSRADVLAYLQSRRQRWREDESNTKDFAWRNRVRHEVLPLLEQRLNPAIRQALLRLADIAAAEDEVMVRLVAQARKGTRPGPAPLAIRRRLALDELRRQGLPPGEIDFAAIDSFSMPWKKSKKVFHSVENRPKHFPYCGKSAQKFSILWKNPASGHHADQPPLDQDPYGLVPGENMAQAPPDLVSGVNKAGSRPRGKPPLSLPARHAPAGPVLRVRMGRGFSRRADEVCLSAAAVAGRDLVFRSWRAGDRMNPLGMAGRKKLSDIFTDLKVPRAERDSWIVVECGGQIAALAGGRVSRDFAVESPRAPSIRIQWPARPKRI